MTVTEALYKHRGCGLEWAIRKRWLKSVCLSFCQNEVSDSAALTADGRAFQVCAANTRNQIDERCWNNQRRGVGKTKTSSSFHISSHGATRRGMTVQCCAGTGRSSGYIIRLVTFRSRVRISLRAICKQPWASCCPTVCPGHSASYPSRDGKWVVGEGLV